MDTQQNLSKKEARNWWHNNLSINEQKIFANKHLANFEISMLTGSAAEYTSVDKYNEIIVKIWEAEGKTDGLKPEGFIWE